MQFAKASVAVPWCRVNAHFHEEQVSLGVTAVTQACCELALQNNSDQWGSGSALTSDAVLWCRVNAHLYEDQVSLGVTAETQACCELALQSNSDQ